MKLVELREQVASIVGLQISQSALYDMNYDFA